jgi:two-component system NtrC family response regulator
MSKKRRRVLLVDDDESFRRVQAFKLEQAGYEVTSCADGETAIDSFGEGSHDVAVTDIRMPGIDGLELLGRLRAISPDTPVVIITGHGTIETAVEAMKEGAFDFLTKPFPGDHLRLTLERATEMANLERENRELRRAVEGKFSFENLVGISPPMRRLYEAVELAAPAPSTVLLRGETGTGKELVARAIHYNSPRRKEPFVIVNCGALPNTLVEAELFGHQKGAFTGADRQRAGKFVAADGGTLFLDEIGEIPLDLQPKILRALQTGEVDRIGQDTPSQVDVRIIAATNRDLDKLIAEGSFRSDLYYRLAVIPLEVPALRERREDIPLLVQHFLSRLGDRTGRPGLRFPREAMPLFDRYPWPGNVRELENVVERMVVMSREETLSLDTLPDAIRRPPEPTGSSLRLPVEGVDFESLEKDFIRQALERTEGNRTRAAQLLGVTRNTLLYRIQKFGLQ